MDMPGAVKEARYRHRSNLALQVTCSVTLSVLLEVSPSVNGL